MAYPPRVPLFTSRVKRCYFHQGENGGNELAECLSESACNYLKPLLGLSSALPIRVILSASTPEALPTSALPIISFLSSSSPPPPVRNIGMMCALL